MSIGDEQVADATAAEWQGAHQYHREAEETESGDGATATTSNLEQSVVGVIVTAAELAEWSVVCDPKLS